LSNVVNKEQILSIVLQHVRAVLPELKDSQLRGTDSLKDLGANSLDRADIVMGVMEELSLQISRVALSGPRNLGELVDLIHEKLQRG
jgi:polyketide biosynthesis acyl carrier protein